ACRRLARRIIPRLGWGGQQPRMPNAHCWRDGGSYPHAYSVVADGGNRRCGGENQIDIIVVDQSDAGFVVAVSLAGRVCGVFSKSVERRGRAGLHPATTRTSCRPIISGRAAGVVSAVRDRMG